MAQGYVGIGKRRLMARGTGITAASTQVTPTDLRGCKAINFLHIVTSCAGGADTADAKVQGSFDKTTWFDWVAFTQAAAAANEVKSPTLADSTMPRWARVVLTPGAGATVTSEVWMIYERKGDGSMPPTKAALTTPTGTVA